MQFTQSEQREVRPERVHSQKEKVYSYVSNSEDHIL